MIAQTRSSTSVFFIFVLLIAAAAILVVRPMLAVPSVHAVKKHGAEMVRQAMECGLNAKNQAQMVGLYDRTRDRVGIACTDGIKFYVIIFVKSTGENVTAYEREMAKSLKDVINYLRSCGYVENESFAFVKSLFR